MVNSVPFTVEAVRIVILLLIPMLFAWSVDLGSPVLRVVFSQNRIGAITYDGHAYLFNLKGEKILEEKIGDVGVSLNAFGGLFAYESNEGIYLFNSYGKLIGVIEVPEGFYGSLVHSVVFIAMAGKRIGLFYVDYANNLALREIWSLEGLSAVAPSALVDSENYLVVADYRGSVYLLRLNGKVEYRIRADTNLYSLDVCDNLLAIGGKGVVLLYDIGDKPKFLGKMKVAGIAMVAFNDLCEKLAVSDSAGKLIVVDLESKNVTKVDLRVSPISIDWRCQEIAIGSKEGKLMIMNIAERKEEREVRVDVLGNLTR